MNRAAYYGPTEIVEMLIKADAYPEAIDRYGNTVLMVAVCGNCKEVVEMLIKAGANLNGSYGGYLFGSNVKTKALIFGNIEVQKIVNNELRFPFLLMKEFLSLREIHPYAANALSKQLKAYISDKIKSQFFSSPFMDNNKKILTKNQIDIIRGLIAISSNYSRTMLYKESDELKRQLNSIYENRKSPLGASNISKVKFFIKNLDKKTCAFF